MSPPTSPQVVPDEETPLLHDEGAQRKPTPLPKTQLFILLLVRLADPVTAYSISPYISELVSQLSIIGGDKRKVGYYTGMLMSIHYAAEAAMVFQWSRFSDHIGRKPILLLGLAGSVVSTILFGLSRSFWALVLSRCLNGFLNGNLGVIKSMIAELTDDTNVARGFSLLPMARAAAYIIGPFIGGVLSRPQDHWPNRFSGPFWAEYPYFLPCLVAATYALVSFIVTALYLEEKRTTEVPKQDQPLPLRALLTRPVLLSISSYAMIALLDMAAMALIPLVWSTPVELGGLDLSPSTIGLWLSGYGCLNGVIQFTMFPRVVTRLGPGRVVLTSVAAYMIIYSMFPLQNLAAHARSAGVWLLVVLQLASICITDMGFNSVFMFIAAAAPNKRSLGATNGLAQTVVAVQRMVAPAAAASLFAFSLAHDIMGGNFTYVVLLGVVCFGLGVAAQLPRHTWKHGDTK
ncbi:major facilitator superfamily domain-containing protein [Lactarius quietus]|nr:major facilitator superfamily domain-containing protein [Lactarius quietus]